MIEQISDYDSFRDYFLEQWKNSPNLNALVSASMVQANKMELAVFEVRDLMNLNTATGTQLDTIGKVWGVYRETSNDDAYRLAIKEKKSRTFSGEPEAIIEILLANYGATSVEYSPEYPAKYRLVSDGYLSQEVLNNISAAGVGAVLGGNIIDALGNFLVDAFGNNIIHVNPNP